MIYIPRSDAGMVADQTNPTAHSDRAERARDHVGATDLDQAIDAAASGNFHRSFSQSGPVL